VDYVEIVANKCLNISGNQNSETLKHSPSYYFYTFDKREKQLENRYILESISSSIEPSIFNGQMTQ